MYDHSTGRPKGFGFAEYADADSAASAVRNLNDHEIMGRRLRVDFSHEGDKVPADDDAPPPQFQAANGGDPVDVEPPMSSTASDLPPLPPGVELPPGVSCPEAISRTLATLPPTQLLEIVSQMKGLVMADPAKATELLTQAPQLAYAIFQALLLMGLVDTAALQSVIEQNAQSATPALPPDPAPAPPPSVVQPQPYSAFPTYHPHAQAPTPASQGQVFSVPAPAVQAPVPTPQPPPPPPPPPPPGPASALAPTPQPATIDKAALFQYVLGLTHDQLNAMPPMERDQIMGVRQQIISGALTL